MSLSDDLIKKLKGKFEPSTTTQFRYRTNELLYNQMQKEMLSVFLSARQMIKASSKEIVTAAL
jgi:hypothetical protein